MKTKQSFKQVVSNNWFLLKFCLIEAPSYSFIFIIEIIRYQLVIFLEHTLGINFVLESAEFARPYKNVLIFLISLLLFVGVGLMFNALIYQKLQLKALPKIKKKFKNMMYQKAKEIDLECYDNPEFYNDFVLSISESERQIDRTFQFIEKLFTGLTVIITSGAFYLAKDTTSILFIVVSFILSFVFTQVMNRVNFTIRLQKNPHERKRSYVNRVFYLNEYAKEIRLNPDVSDIMMQHLDNANAEIYKIDKEIAKKKFILSFIKDYLCNDFISDVLYITYLIYKAAVLHTISYSSVVVLFNSAGRFKNSLRLFTDIYPFAEETSLYIDKINKFLALEPKITSEKSQPVSSGAKKIELKNVSFAYNEKDGNIINNISMSIEPNQKIALVGYNGAGKTTLIKLIMRLYDTSSGDIFFDDVNIKDYDVEEYKNSIGAVFQDFNLYAASVKENVVLDNSEGAKEEKIISALDKSGFRERLDTLKYGLDTNLTTEFEEDGTNLSGGESQKIAISRVFFKDCGLVILDEPSSALDPIAEYHLNHSMLRATEHKTVIFISHRLSTTRLADKIFMLENGRIIEQGSHTELLNKDGKYAQMWKAQAGQYLTV